MSDNKYNSWINPSLLKLNPYQPGKPISELHRETGIEEEHILKLASNENPLGMSPKAIKALSHIELLDLHRYPDGAAFDLKQKLANRLGVLPNQLILGNGSDEVLRFYAQTFVKPDEEILISQYAFQTFLIIAHMVSAIPVIVPATDWHHDVEAFIKHVGPKTRLMFLANPNNPTGTWFTHNALVYLLESLPENVLVVLDEAYYDYIDDPEYPRAIQLQQRFPNLLITRTFSKIYGLAGLRVGFGITHTDLNGLIQRTRLPFNVSIPAQKAALAALDDFDFVEQSLIVNEQGRKQLEQGLMELGYHFISRAGNFITAEFPDDAMKYYQKLLQQGIIVRPLANMGMPNHLRITIGRADENNRILNALSEL